MALIGKRRQSQPMSGDGKMTLVTTGDKLHPMEAKFRRKVFVKETKTQKQKLARC